MKIGLIDIFRVAGFDPSVRTKVARHKDNRCSIENLRHNNWLELYQAYQKRPVFHNVKQIVSFYGLSGTRAGFYGVYKVLDHLSASQGPKIPPGQKWDQGCNYFYKLTRDRRFDDLRDRLVIEWGKGAQNWSHWLSTKRDKEVLEMLAPGRWLDPFVDYLKFSLRYSELQELFKRQEAHRDWKNQLSAVAGVYLILAETTGDMYVGSAYGTTGIWGRWQAYARKGHGENKYLKKLIENDSSYPSSFRFSVLQILPRSTTKKEVLEWERRYMEKLGTRAKGLN